MKNFMESLKVKWDEGKFICIGLDSDIQKIPKEHLSKSKNINADQSGQFQSEFNKEIVEATNDLVCAYKLNVAFYEELGPQGTIAIATTITDIHSIAPGVPVILDYKRGDIGNTNLGYVKSAFEFLHADAVTVSPYLGAEALKPFLDMKDKGIIVLCRTSNPGGGEFQNMLVNTCIPHLGAKPLYYYVAYRVSKYWNQNNNCCVVVGATCPDELREVRAVVGDMPILIPGIGAQGGDVEETVTAGRDSQGQGMIINSSRGIIFSSSGDDFAEAARQETLKLHELINKFRKVG